MAAGNWTLYNQAKSLLGSAGLNFGSANINMILATTSYTPNADAHATYADVSGSEVAAGGGYSSGGLTLSGNIWSLGAKSAVIAAGGSGYAVSSTFNVTVSGGTFSTAAVVNVTTNGSGVVTTVNSITTFGAYTVLPTGPVATTGGAGTGLTLTITWMAYFSSSNVQWTSSTITARYAVLVLRAGGSLTSTDKLIAYGDLTGGGSASDFSGTFQVTLSGVAALQLS